MKILPTSIENFPAFETQAQAKTPSNWCDGQGVPLGISGRLRRTSCLLALDVRQRFCQRWFMEAAVQRELPLVDLVAGQRSWLREFLDAGRLHGPLIFRAHVPAILDVSRQRVHELIEKGQLKTVAVRGQEFVAVRELEKYFEQDHKNGVPRNVELSILRRFAGSKKS